MDSVDKVNKLSKSDFISIFGNVFEKTTWIAEKVFAFKPFENFGELTERFLNIFENEKKENHLKVLNFHPELAVEKIMTVDSKKEQNNAELNQCTKEELEEFVKLKELFKNWDEKLMKEKLINIIREGTYYYINSNKTNKYLCA